MSAILAAIAIVCLICGFVVITACMYSARLTEDGFCPHCGPDELSASD